MMLRNWQKPGFVVGVALLTLSATLHAAGMLAVAPSDALVQQPAGGQGQTAALGSSFADFAAGSVPVTPAAQQPETATVQEAVQQVAQPPVSAAPAPQVPQSAVAPVQAPQAQRPDLAAQTAAPPDRQEAVAQDSTASAAPARSARPQARPDARAQAAPQQPPAPRQPQQATPRPAGNAQADARRGSATGQQAGQTTTAGQTQTPQAESGNAAASNYPGEVLRKITRQRRAPAPRGGTVLVAFSIAGSGGLASASVARSSGSPALDRVALDHIRRSAPFAPPPRGAQTSFTFEFVSNR